MPARNHAIGGIMRRPHSEQRPDLSGVSLLLLTAAGWGANWPALKTLLQELPPLAARGWSGLAAALILASMAGATGVPLAVPRREWGRLLLAAFLNVTAWMGFATLALWWLPAGEGAILAYTMPVWTALFAWPLLGETPGPLRIIALLCGVGGIALLFGAEEMQLGLAKLPGAAFMLGGSMLFALGTVMTKRWPLSLPPVAATAWQIGLGCVPLIPLSLLLEEPDFVALTPEGWGFFAYMTVFPLCICYLAWFAALRRLPASVATIGTLLAPVVGVLSASAFLGEQLGVREIGALGVTLLGVLLAARG